MGSFFSPWTYVPLFPFFLFLVFISPSLSWSRSTEMESHWIWSAKHITYRKWDILGKSLCDQINGQNHRNHSSSWHWNRPLDHLMCLLFLSYLSRSSSLRVPLVWSSRCHLHLCFYWYSALSQWHGAKQITFLKKYYYYHCNCPKEHVGQM